MEQDTGYDDNGQSIDIRQSVCARPCGAVLRLGAGASQVFSEQNMEFMEKIIERSGLGDETGLSDGILSMRDPDTKLGTTLKAATDETQMVIFEVAANLLKKTNVRPDQARSPFCTPYQQAVRQQCLGWDDAIGIFVHLQSTSRACSHRHLGGVRGL